MSRAGADAMTVSASHATKLSTRDMTPAAEVAPSERASGTPESPLVSIGMPAFNSERFIGQSIDALIAQDYPNIELIISDDGSSDATARIARSYAERDPRVSFH